MTLVEVVVAAGIASIILAAVMMLVLYSARSFAALSNYVDLDNFSRNALDVMTQEIRQAHSMTAGSAQSMTFVFMNPTNSADTWTVTYRYDSSLRTLNRDEVRGGSRTTSVLLQECDVLRFSYYRRNPSSTTPMEPYAALSAPLSSPAVCKLVQMNWICSRSILQRAVNTESVQSARIVVRKV